jgi:peptidoglycan-associated lipoprotein
MRMRSTVTILFLAAGIAAACRKKPEPPPPPQQAAPPPTDTRPTPPPPPPARGLEAAAERARVALREAIYFDYDQDNLRDDARRTLDAKVPILLSNRAVRLRIAGHTDERGSDEYNIALGQRRAAAARRYLVQQGVEESRIDIVSFGEERPTCRDASEGCWSRNRRDEFEIVAGGDQIRVEAR